MIYSIQASFKVRSKMSDNNPLQAVLNSLKRKNQSKVKSLKMVFYELNVKQKAVKAKVSC